jgi:hypothetical protein
MEWEILNHKLFLRLCVFFAPLRETVFTFNFLSNARNYTTGIPGIGYC